MKRRQFIKGALGAAADFDVTFDVTLVKEAQG